MNSPISPKTFRLSCDPKRSVTCTVWICILGWRWGRGGRCRNILGYRIRSPRTAPHHILLISAPVHSVLWKLSDYLIRQLPLYFQQKSLLPVVQMIGKMSWQRYSSHVLSHLSISSSHNSCSYPVSTALTRTSTPALKASTPPIDNVRPWHPTWIAPTRCSPFVSCRSKAPPQLQLKDSDSKPKFKVGRWSKEDQENWDRFVLWLHVSELCIEEEHADGAYLHSVLGPQEMPQCRVPVEHIPEALGCLRWRWNELINMSHAWPPRGKSMRVLRRWVPRRYARMDMRRTNWSMRMTGRISWSCTMTWNLLEARPWSIGHDRW